MLLFCDESITRKRHWVFKLYMLPRAFSSKERYKDAIYFGLLSWQTMTLQSSFKLSGKSSSSKENHDMLQAFLCCFTLIGVHQTTYVHNCLHLHSYYYYSVPQNTYVYKCLFSVLLLLLRLLLFWINSWEIFGQIKHM